MSRVVTIVQARMGSTRLPGKVLMDLAGRTVLARVVERVGDAKRAGIVVVATSDLERDRPVVDHCRDLGVECYRGSESDVLARYRDCARAFDAETVMRITADCPLLDPDLFDATVELHEELAADYVAFRDLPKGIPGETLSMRALEESFARAKEADEREHVIHYIVRRSDTYRVYLLPAPQAALRRPDVNVSLDTPADLDRIRAVHHTLGPSARTLDIIRWADAQSSRAM